MNARRLLVSGLMLISVLFSACAPAPMKATSLPVIQSADTTIPATTAPEPLTSDPNALTTVAGNYIYSVVGKNFNLILNANGSYISLASSGTFMVTTDQITFVERSFDCASQPGVYEWSLANNILRLKPAQDDCQRRANVFGSQEFEKVPANNTSAVIVWETPTAVNGIATDSLGNVYITDGSRGFSKYDGDGKLLGSWPDRLSSTTGIAVDGQGNIYVANFEPPEIHKFTPQGNPLLTWSIADGIGPVGLAADPQGNVYVALHRIHDHYIEKYDPQGKLLGTWAKPESAGGQIKAGPRTGPSFMAVATNGDNYVEDGKQAYKYDKDGKFLYGIPKHCSVAVDGQGNLYLSVSEDGSILKFDSDGKQIGEWSVSIPGSTPGYGYGLAVDKNGDVFLYSETVLAKITLPEQ